MGRSQAALKKTLAACVPARVYGRGQVHSLHFSTRSVPTHIHTGEILVNRAYTYIKDNGTYQ